MIIIALESLTIFLIRKTNVPTTPRGRALYTTDWFLNGKPILNNHDNPRVTLRNGLPCC